MDTSPSRRVVAGGAAWRRAALLMGAASFGWVVVTVHWPAPRAFAKAPPAAAPAAVQARDDGRFNQPQLEQLLAPIALHPDELLMQMLMAATYPLEVVQAHRWLQQGQNARLRGCAAMRWARRWWRSPGIRR
jgi:hypothetical protein